VLVTVQLIDPRTNVHLWSENYDREFAGIFAIQADIATRIADAMQAELSPSEMASIQSQMTNSPEAYALYLQALELANWYFGPTDNTPEVHGLLDRAIVLDANFARAHAAKALVYMAFEPDVESGLAHAEQALAIDPELGLAHAAMARYFSDVMRDQEADESFATALRLSPNDTTILNNASTYYAVTGQMDLAESAARRLIDLDPGRVLPLMRLYDNAGDRVMAVAVLRQGVEFQPNSSNLHRTVAVLESLLGNHEAAETELRIAKSLASYDFSKFDRRFALDAIKTRLAGDEAYAIEMVNAFHASLERYPDQYASPGLRAFASWGAGDFENLLPKLEVLADRVSNGRRSELMIRIVLNGYEEPELESPEFVDVRKRLGFDADKLRRPIR
jgi:Tfp pilus assembly protein PilF